MSALLCIFAVYIVFYINLCLLCARALLCVCFGSSACVLGVGVFVVGLFFLCDHVCVLFVVVCLCVFIVAVGFELCVWLCLLVL